MSVRFAKHWFTAREYERMGEVGILPAGERYELIEGEIVKRSPIGKRHAAYVDALAELFREQLQRKVVVRVQNPILLDDFAEPQPDICLLKRREDFYRDALPMPLDVLLVVEVSDTTLEYDRQVKLPLYAAAGIPEFLIVNLPDEQLEYYTQPAQNSYQVTRILKRGETLTLPGLPDLVISVAEVLG